MCMLSIMKRVIPTVNRLMRRLEQYYREDIASEAPFNELRSICRTHEVHDNIAIRDIQDISQLLQDANFRSAYASNRKYLLPLQADLLDIKGKPVVVLGEAHMATSFEYNAARNIFPFFDTIGHESRFERTKINDSKPNALEVALFARMNRNLASWGTHPPEEGRESLASRIFPSPLDLAIILSHTHEIRGYKFAALEAEHLSEFLPARISKKLLESFDGLGHNSDRNRREYHISTNSLGRAKYWTKYKMQDAVFQLYNRTFFSNSL